MRFTTPNGDSIEFTAIDGGYDVHTRNDSGESISTVQMSHVAGRALMALAAAHE